MIIPSIDLMNGKAVQLRQGKEKVLERNNPLELAREFNKFNEIAVIDLDAALGTGENTELIRDICAVADCRVGGGIRSIEKAKEYISYGAHKIIVGSSAFNSDSVNHEFLKDLNHAIGREHIIIAIDAMGDRIVTKGWTYITKLNLFEVISETEQYCSEYLFTCVEKEGKLQGTDLESVVRIQNETKNLITLAGGIKSINEIKQAAELGVNAQIGMALYKGIIKLEDAFIASLNWKNELIPTIAIDEAGQVLMLAYSNEESLRKAFEIGNMCYFSRSRGKLWMKGESSGHVQKVLKLRADCDHDTILVTVAQKDVACHTGSYSCFGDKEFNMTELYRVIQDRFENPVPGSYTATLDDVKVKEKLMEEAQEVIETNTRDEVIWEAADLLYFLTVYLVKKNVSFDEVLHELRRRRKK